jgi:hypothetical protein
MDIDCDGVTTAECNIDTDPAYQDGTSLETSSGGPFDAATMPYVVIPNPSSRFSYGGSNIDPRCQRSRAHLRLAVGAKACA